jgi:hypothetical protein
MVSAIEQLATELMKVSDDTWARITGRRCTGLDWQADFGPAWEELSERLVQREPVPEYEARCESRTQEPA